MSEQTIKDVLEALHDAMQKALPDMDVTINIQVGAKKNTAEVKKEEPVTAPEGAPAEATAEAPATETNLACLKATLNAYVKAAGKKKTFELVREFTNGSDNPADIPPKKYPKIFARMKDHGVDRIEVDLSKKDKEAA